MAIVKWDPWPELRAMQDQMTRLLEMSQDRVAGEPFEQGLWQPPVDIYEDDREVVVKMEIPEVEQEDIDVQIEDYTLIIQGERRLEKEENKQNYQRIERGYGSFRRVFSLPTAVDAEHTRARCDKGVLKIVLPKKNQGKPRQIEITIE
ncbi:MAG: molecular chaperone [Desulfuromonadaceae bacterium GWC2_58_13]|nr:MAG: molecular chaperone [Desulfuromonadaceae bacterium GWC2_58_13]